MKILHVIDSMSIGGAEILLVDIINELQQKKIFTEQHLVCIYNRKDESLLKQLPPSTKILFLDVKKKNFISKLYFLKKYLERNKFSVIHTHLCDATLFTRLALKSNSRLVSTYHGQYYNKNSSNYSSWRKWLDRLTYNSNHYIIFVSQTVKEIIAESVGINKNFEVISNFANRRFLPLYTWNENYNLKLISVGSLREPKNYELAIECLADNANITLDIYGTGELQNNLQALINKTNSNVSLKGNKIITSALLTQYDAFLMTSSHEGMPVSLIEAMRSGLPPIVSNIPAIKNVCKDAAIFFRNNDVNSLKEVLLHTLNNKKVLKLISQKAIDNYREYDITIFMDKLLAIYKKIMS